MSGLLTGMASLLIWWALVCPVFAQSHLLSATGFGPSVTPPPDLPADERCLQHSVEISGIRCFSHDLHTFLNVTEECARAVKETNFDPLFCDGPRSNTSHPSASTEPPQGGLSGLTFDLPRAADLLLGKAAQSKEAQPAPEGASQPPKGSLRSSAPNLTFNPHPLPHRLDLARYPELGHLNYGDTNDQFAKVTRELGLTREDNERIYENFRRAETKRENQGNAMLAMTTGNSLWYGRNLATEDSTLSFIKAVTNNSEIATKIAPPLFRIIKSKPTGAALLVTIGAGATYYLYEFFGFDKSVEPLAVIHDGAVSALPRP
jgi:hypothetical protein